MLKTLITMIAIFLSGCTGSGQFIKQTPIVYPDGTKVYLLVNDSYEWKSINDYAEKNLVERAEKICPSGYDLMNKESRRPTDPFMQMDSSRKELVWQIKCKNQS